MGEVLLGNPKLDVQQFSQGLAKPVSKSELAAAVRKALDEDRESPGAFQSAS
jgi:hypothetical protein